MHKLSHQSALSLGLVGIIVLLLPYFILGTNSFITIHDFLDSNPVHMKTILSLGLVGNPEGVIPVLDGVSSMSYVPLIPLDIKTILYMILPMYWAIVTNIVIVKVIAFIGMYVFCTKYLIKGNNLVALLVSLLFSMVPFYSDYSLSAAGVPLFLYAFFNLENKRNLILSYIVIAFFTCNSSLTLVGFFICLLWLAWILVKCNREHNIPKCHVFGLLIMGLLYLFVNISILYSFFFPSGVISHRIEFGNNGTILSSLLDLTQLIFLSQYHAGSFLAILVVCTSFILFALYGKGDKQIKILFYLYLSLIALIFVGTLVRFIPINIFRSFQFDRFYFFYPALCFLILAKALSFISNKKVVVYVVSCFVAIGTLAFDKEFRTNVASICGIHLQHSPSYSQYFDDELFSQIKAKCNSQDDYCCKVVSVGIHPTVAEYHGFYTLDSYVYNYSLDYKHKFRKIISKELEKDVNLKNYFDKWGSRCYIFSNELYETGNQYLFGKNDNIVINHLDIDLEALRELGCQYIISSVRIKNYDELGLFYKGRFTSPDSYWALDLYCLE